MKHEEIYTLFLVIENKHKNVEKIKTINLKDNYILKIT